MHICIWGTPKEKSPATLNHSIDKPCTQVNHTLAQRHILFSLLSHSNMDPVWILLTRNIKAVNFFSPPHSYRPINRVASKRSVCQKYSSCSPRSVLIPFPAYSSPNSLYPRHAIKITAKVKKISHRDLYAFGSHSSYCYSLPQPFSNSSVKCTI